MSGKANNAGIYNFDNLNAQTLYIKGKRFEDYINDLVFEDQLEQDEITEIKLLLEYLDTTGLNSAWLVNNGNTNETLRSAITALQTKLANIDTTALTESSVLTNDNRNSVLKTAIGNVETSTQYLNAPYTTNGGQTSYFTNGLQVWNGTTEAGNGIFSYQNDHTPTNQIELRSRNDKKIKLSGGGIDLAPASTKTVDINNADGKFTFTVGNSSIADYATNSIIRMNGDIQLNGDGTETGISIYKQEAQGFEPLKRNVDIRAADSVRIFGRNPYIEADDGGYISVATDIKLQVDGGGSPGTIAIQVGGDCELNKRGQIKIGTLQDTTALGYTEITIGQTSVAGRNSSTFLDGDTYIPINPVNPEAYDYIMYAGMPTIYSGALHGPIKTTFTPYFKSLSTFSVKPTINSFIQSSGTFSVAVGLGAITLNAGLGGVLTNCAGGVISMTALAGGINLLTGAGGIAMTTGGGACAITTGGGPIQLQTSTGDIVIDSGSKGTGGSTYITPKDYLILNPEDSIIVGSNGNKPVYTNLINTNYEYNGNLFTADGANNVIYSAVFTTGTQPIFLRPSATAQILLATGLEEDASGNAYMVIQNTATNAILYTSSTTTILPSTTNATFTFGNGADQVLPNSANLRAGVYVVGTVTNYRYKSDSSNAAVMGKIGVNVDAVVRPNESSTSHYLNIFGTARFQDKIDTVADIELTSEANQNTTTLTNNSITTTGAVQSNSLVINGNYTGNTDARLYKNADNKLMWNGAEVGAGGVSSGGITYMVNVASNISNPSPTPTETIITAAYSGNPQRTITQAVTANTAYYIAKYTTQVFDEVTNPVLTGLQQLNQYLIWNSQNQVGQIYGQLWFQATAIGFGVLYQRTYASPVTTTAAQLINGTPIPTPKGLYNIKFQRVVFPNINVVVSSGPVVLRYRVEGLVSGYWTSLYSMLGLVPPTVSSTTSNLSVSLDESVILSQTTPGATAVRLVLFISSGTGTISQTSAGGADLAAYSLIGLGENTPALFRTMLYDGTNAKITVPYSTTPTLVEYDLAIDAPYNVSAFASPTLSTDLYFIQPAGGFANHAITLYFNEGSISHYHSTIAGQTTSPTLAQVLNSGATASQPINMNTNKISGITALEGSSNGNWNVKEITAAQGSGISVTPTNGSYAIANSGVLSVAAASASAGITVSTTNGAVSLQNSGIISITSGTGISVTTTNGAAVITNTSTGTAAVLQNIRDEHQSLYEVGALPRKPDYWATNWSVADSTVRKHLDIYVSVDGKIIVSAVGDFTIRYSTDYGTTWNDATGLSIATTWTSICGTSSGSKLFAFGTFQPQNQGTPSLVLYTSTTQGATWTQITSTAFSGLIKVNRVRCSGDGTYLLASDNTEIEDGRILYSTNGGTTWARQAPGDLPLGRIEGAAVSRSGAIQFLTWINSAGTDSRILRSIDYGFTWSEVSGHLSGGNWTRIESDATGRYVWATRYVNINTQDTAAYRSDNYGVTWVLAGMNSIEDIWVSATGQFMAGVSVPNTSVIDGLANRSFLVYSVDYGRTVQIFSLSNTTTFRTINGSADGSVLVVGSVNYSEGNPSHSGDGLLRIARQGQQNIQDLSVVGGTIAKLGGTYTLTNDVVLWFSGGFEIQTGNPQYKVDFDFLSAGKIDLFQYNIRYEIDCYWSTGTWSYIYPLLSINDVRNIDVPGTNPNISHDPLSGLTNWTNNINNGTYGGSEVYAQTYNNRFFAGYFPGSSTNMNAGANNLQRQKSLIKGTLSLHRRPAAQTGITDAAQNARDIYNIFTCDNYSARFYSGMLYLMNSNAQQGIDYGINHQRINGTGIFAAESVFSYNAMGAGTAMASGVSRLGLHLSEGGNTDATRARAAHYTYRIYRERK